MSWADVHARKAVLDTVLSRARRDPTGPLQLSGIAHLERLFSSADGVLLALQHRWSTHLAAKLDQAAEDGTGPDVAWDQLAAEQPTLRAVLDAGARRSRPLRDARRTEQWIIDTFNRGYTLPPRYETGVMTDVHPERVSVPAR